MRNFGSDAARVITGLGIAVLAVSCATSGYRQAERSTASMNDTRDVIINARRQVAVTMGTLNQLAGQPEADLVALFNEFTRNLRDVDRSSSRVRSQTDTMRSRSERFLASWESELGSFSSEEARQRSEARRAEIAAQYDQLVNSMDHTRTAFEPLMNDLRDIERLLGTDLTRAGVQSSASLVAKANADAKLVQDKAAVVLHNLDQMTKALSPPAK